MKKAILLVAGLLCSATYTQTAAPDALKISQQIVTNGEQKNDLSETLQKYERVINQCLKDRKSYAAAKEAFNKNQGFINNRVIHDPKVNDFNCQAHALIYLDCQSKTNHNFDKLNQSYKNYMILSYILTQFRYRPNVFSKKTFGITENIDSARLVKLMQLKVSQFSIDYLLNEVQSLKMPKTEKAMLIKILGARYLPYQKEKRSGLQVVSLLPSAMLCLLLAQQKGIPIIVEMHRYVENDGNIQNIGTAKLYYQPMKNGYKYIPEGIHEHSKGEYVFRMYSICNPSAQQTTFGKAYANITTAKNMGEFIKEFTKLNIVDTILSTAVNAQQYGPAGGGIAQPASGKEYILRRYNKIIRSARATKVHSPHDFKTSNPKHMGMSIPFNVEHVLVTSRQN